MTMVKKEKSFPRGGKKPAISKVKKGSFSLFTKRSAKRHKEKKGKQSSQSSQKKKKLPDSSLHLSYVQPLCNKTIRDGIVVLGCVRSIEEYKLTVSLPGKLIGEVAITNISEPYTDALENVVEGKNVDDEKVFPLNKMFELGQCVVARVVDVGEKIKLSLMPQVVQANWTTRSLTVGSFVMAAVRSHEENGYVMDTGIKTVRAFLKKSAAQKYENIWNKGRSFGIGQVLKCVVRKSNISAVAATVELSADPKKLCNPLDVAEASLDMLLPGTVFNTTISQVINNGLEIEYNGKLTGYVHEEHLSEVFDSQQNYSVGDPHEAVLLYVLPMVKLAHFSFKKFLHNPEPSSGPLSTVNLGEVMKGKVMHSDGHGVVLRLQHQYKGFVPIHHCPKDVAEENKKIEVGSKRKCRILAYDYMAEIFICTLRKELITASVIHPADLKPGMKVLCQIKEHLKKGTLVAIDAGARSIMAFVRTEHLGNIPVKNPENKFPIGNQRTAKVLHVDGNNVQLTLKPKLVENEAKSLHSFKQFKKGMACEGVVMLIKKKGLLVTFFGEVKGWLPLEEESKDDKFYVGQLLKCFVHEVNVSNARLVLSLSASIKEKATVQPRERYKVGHAYRVTVTKCTEKALKVKGEYGLGSILAQHLTNNPHLASSLLKTYSPGDVIENAYCFQSQHPFIFTLQPPLLKHFQAMNGSCCEWSEMSEGQILPCSVESFIRPKILVQLPMNKRKPTLVLYKELPDKLVKHQCLMCRILKKDNLGTTMCVSVRLSHCWDYTPKAAVDLLVSYWRDCKRIAKHLKIEENPLAKLRPGDRVKGTVIATEDCGTVIKLSCGAKGVVTPFMGSNNIKCGSEVEGTVVFIDFPNNCCELTINPSIMRRINVKQDGRLTNGLQIGADVRGEVLAVRPELVVVVLKGRGRKQLAYIPVRRHLNDFAPNMKHYQLGKISKLIIVAVEKKKIVCILQRHEFHLIKLRAGRVIRKQSLMKNSLVKSVSVDSLSEDESETDIIGKDDDYGKEREEKDGGINLDDDDDDGNDDDNDETEEEGRMDMSGEVEDEEKQEEDGGINLDDDDDDDETEEEGGMDMSGEDEDEEEQKEVGDEIVIKEDSVKNDVKNNKETDDVISESCTRKRSSKTETVERTEHEDKIKKRKLSQQNEQKQAQDNTNLEPLPRLSLNGGFVWDANPSMLLEENEETDSDGSANVDNTKKGRNKKTKLSRAEKREKALQQEEEIRAAEQKLMNPDGPQTADDFDRLVLSSPNSSICWIKYMAFHLQAAEIEKARAVARRAINTMSFREEKEKFNVWCSLLSLENLYGSKESLDKTLEEALSMNDPFKVYTHMLQLYAESSKTQEAEKLVTHVTKKFHEDKEAWLQGGEALLKLGKTEKSRLVMQKALNNVEKKFHVEVISRFARLENRLGDPERAQTLMEFILTSYPKRTDIWISYVDMLVKNGQHEVARQVLERAIAQKLPVRRMKSLFSKFLQFEEQYGTLEGVAKIRQKAIDYVEASGGATGEKES